ncbi:SGNH/GDSL hydrolase family protein [Chitinophaga caseinilytica]|uniref:SGNH/GDSL hydrolase family protein n=1 Tax=Chitinophaga caseinilytica TaxID=2267521 RepID=UPI003C2FF4E3
MMHRFTWAVLCCLMLGCAVAKHKKEARKKPVVFMGDSITQGWQALMPEFFAGKPYVNKGIGGQTTRQMLARFQADVLDLHPHAVVILGGTNDIAGLGGDMPVDSIFRNIVAMAGMASAKGIKVVLCSVIPAYEYACCKTVKPVPLIAALNEKISRYCREEGIPFVDYFPVLADEKRGLAPVLTGDGVHPNRAGYEKMRPLLEKAIARSYQ